VAVTSLPLFFSFFLLFLFFWTKKQLNKEKKGEKRKQLKTTQSKVRLESPSPQIKSLQLASD